MADVKWIKLATGLPDNRKIKQIRRLPDGDTIALMWIFLMCLAGETNDEGMVYFTPEIPFTDEMLADQFGIDINTIRLGLATFQRFGMVEIVDNIICLSHWEKWQSVDGLAVIREQTRKRVAKHREKQKLAAGNVTCNVTVTQSNATDIDREEDKKRKEKDINISDSAPKSTKPVKHKHGEYANVLLTDEELDKLKVEYPTDWEERIERLSSYVESTGKRYKSHYATIRNWARKDGTKGGKQTHEPPGRSDAAFRNIGTWL